MVPGAPAPVISTLISEVTSEGLGCAASRLGFAGGSRTLSRKLWSSCPAVRSTYPPEEEIRFLISSFLVAAGQTTSMDE